MVIDSNGNIGMGVTNPDHGLHIAGINDALHIEGEAASDNYSGGRLTFGDAGFAYIEETTDDILTIYAEREVIFNSSVNGFGTTTPDYPIDTGVGAYLGWDGKWWDASSRELKENIRDLNEKDAFSALEKLKPKRFNYKKVKDDEHLGFIAEDVPELVAAKGRKGLSSMDIVAVLTKVVQQQQKIIIEQDKKLTNLSVKVDNLDRELKLKGSMASAIDTLN
jgi:hypothetical protein